MSKPIYVLQIRICGEEDNVFVFYDEARAEEQAYKFFAELAPSWDIEQVEYTRAQFPTIADLREHVEIEEEIGYFSIFQQEIL